jgi:hypothetical protein
MKDTHGVEICPFCRGPLPCPHCKPPSEYKEVAKEAKKSKKKSKEE